MKFKAEFKMDNAAFKDSAEEIPTILRELANKIGQMSIEQQSEETFQMPIRDSNGNRIGYWVIIE